MQRVPRSHRSCRSEATYFPFLGPGLCACTPQSGNRRLVLVNKKKENMLRSYKFFLLFYSFELAGVWCGTHCVRSGHSKEKKLRGTYKEGETAKRQSVIGHEVTGLWPPLGSPSKELTKSSSLFPFSSFSGLTVKSLSLCIMRGESERKKEKEKGRNFHHHWWQTRPLCSCVCWAWCTNGERSSLWAQHAYFFMRLSGQ